VVHEKTYDERYHRTLKKEIIHLNLDLQFRSAINYVFIKK